jgi:hypothetical protein
VGRFGAVAPEMAMVVGIMRGASRPGSWLGLLLIRRGEGL